jgi:cell division septum initiation protein DivIVA
MSDIIKLLEENARLKAEVERLKQQVQYWKIEAECDHGRWLRCLEDLENLRKECHRSVDQKS